MELNGFEIDVFNHFGIKDGATTWTCPVCSEHRKPINQKQKCMSVFWDTGLGQCSHCGERIQLHTYKKKTITKTYSIPLPRVQEEAYSEVLLKYSREVRGISEITLKRLKIGESERWMPKAGKVIPVIEFPYIVFGKVVNIKYRGKDKDFMFEPGCELVMHNMDSIAHEKECFICEGEWDTAAFVEAGIENVSSVPNGFTLPKKDGTSTVNLSFIDDYYSFFENKEKIYLAVDNDKAGIEGRNEFIRRFGSEKCWLVDFKDCKDANEYLLKYGKEALAEIWKTATQIPVENVETVKDFEQELHDFYLNGCPKGYITGIQKLDENYSIEFGQYCVVLGPPQSGKSEFVDAITLGYAMRYDFKAAFASPENKPNKFHADKIIRKIIGFKPSTIEHLKSENFNRAKQFYNDHFYHVEFNDGYDLEKVLEKFTELVRRKGVRIFVIDPLNKTRLKRSLGKNVNEYTSDYLTEIDIFCKVNKAIVYLVLHPNKMKKEEGTDTYLMPDAYDAKGGGEIFDMAYHMLALVKDKERKLVRAKTLKVKFQHLGTPDVTFWFGWNINNGRYESVDFYPESGVLPQINWNNQSYFNVQETKEEYIDPILTMRGTLNFSEPMKDQLTPNDEIVPF